MEWNTFQLNSDFILTVLLRVLLSFILGGIIGFEREHSNNKPAGFRTHILVCMGACLVVLISHFSITAYAGKANIDPTRIAGQVVSGIGFLGAGAIIRHGVSVKGLTTAASIWIVACVGLACGVGFYSGAIIVTLVVWTVLWFFKGIERIISNSNKVRIIEIEGHVDIKAIQPLNDVLTDYSLSIKRIDILEIANTTKQRIVIKLGAANKKIDMVSLSARIKEIEGVLKVSI
jgi:putative Mg2+ transporter-C (MgtC) family protein